MKRMNTMMSLAIAGALACAAPMAFAQSSTSTQDTGMQHPQSGAMTHSGSMQQYPNQSGTQSGSTMSGSENGSMMNRQSGSMSNQSGAMSNQYGSMSSSSMGSGAMMGQHDMNGTVESVNHKDIVMVKTDDGSLKVHFPNAKQDLKKGDKITLHLSYSMDSGSSSTM